MSGCRTFGSSTGSGSCTMRLPEPVSLMICSAMPATVVSTGLPRLTGSFVSDRISLRMPSTRSLT